MSDALFSALEVEAPSADLTGYRLDRIEVYNWGTFDKQVWTVSPQGQTSLLTGDIGSGKSTLVDAITTLLLPAHRIAYNKAAGADAKERTLRSYVEGHYKSERNEVTGASRPVGLRGRNAYSVILGVFANAGYGEQVSLAQVFHQRDQSGQPSRFFVTASTALSIDPDFSDFGSELKTLRARLRSQGADIDSTFPEYHRRVRRLLGIRSEQAMELFHQTVSMKSVGNLNDFVRDHMLEPVAADAKVRAIVDHYENLVRAHEAVKTATEQLALLAPLMQTAERYDEALARNARSIRARTAVVPFIAERLRELIAAEVTAVQAEQDALERRLEELTSARERLEPERDRLKLERAGVGGDRLRELDLTIPQARDERDDRVDRRRQYAKHLVALGLEEARSEQEFLERAETAQGMRRHLDARKLSIREARDPLHDRKSATRATRDAIERELRSLDGRRNSLPHELDEVRRRLCGELGLDESELPFVAELIDVRGDAAEWRGAAERALRGLALTLLVPQRHYVAVTDWVNGNQLGARLVYLRVAERRVRTVAAERSGGRMLADIIEVEPSEFADFVAAELRHRADHVLAASAAELRNADRAVTREGLIRDRDRHEKDDRRRASDPRFWVMGRGSAEKVAALTVERDELARVLAEVEASLDRLDADDAALASETAALVALADYNSWARLDVNAAFARLEELEQEHAALVAGSSRLVDIDRQLEELAERDAALAAEMTQAHQRIGSVGERLAGLQRRAAQVETDLSLFDEGMLAEAREHYPLLLERTTRASARTIEDCDALREALISQLTNQIEQTQREINGFTTGAQAQMEGILRRWPELRAEMDAQIASIGDYRVMHERVERDDLPRFELEFRHQLKTNAVKELASFNAWLRRQADEIRGRVDTINEALGAIDYNPGRVIVLIAEPTINQDVRQFRSDLRDATADALTDDSDAAAEARFAQVRALIERFKGREGHADSDRNWTRRVTDVRNWFTFAASEQSRDTGEEFEHYTDSDGKSGGQKEKLAYTILAASLAYQFGLEWGVTKSRDFRFAVIDEAFGRGSDASTTYALELFAKLGLQLLIVTPLQKVHVIEPYVSAIGFVDNPTGAASRVHTLTIEEFRERQARA
ncbi:MAG: ATP-binding protein [Microbacterium sp.]